MSDYSSVIQGMFGSGPQSNVAANIDVNPDEAQRNYELSKATGVPESIIAGDPDSFERNSKAALASQIVDGNSYLQQYVQSHPLAAKVSNDDYGNLDNLSQKLSVLHSIHNFLTPFAEHDKVQDPLQRFRDMGHLGSWIPEEDQRNYPVTSTAAKYLLSPIELGMKGILGATMTFVDEAKEAATKIGGEGFGREIAAMTEAELTGMTGRTHIPTEPIRNAALSHNQRTLEGLDDAITAAQSSTTKERAPDLLHDNFIEPQIPEAKVNISGPAAVALYGDKPALPDDGLLGWVPDIQQQLDVSKETGASITVPMSQWIAKVDPEVHKALHDDLQVVPWGITNREAEEAAEAAKQREAAYTPTETYRQLDPNDPWENVVAYNQAHDAAMERNKQLMALGEPQISGILRWTPPKPLPSTPAIGEPVPLVRNATGLEPMFAIGDRKLTMRRLVQSIDPEQAAIDYTRSVGVDWSRLSEYQRNIYREEVSSGASSVEANRFGVEQGFHDFDLINENGQSVGTINLSEQNAGKTLYVEMINGLGEYYNPNNFGPSLMRDLLRQIKAAFPNAETITGHRVSGAREQAGSTSAASAMPKIRLEPSEMGLAGADLRDIFTNAWENAGSGVEALFRTNSKGEAANSVMGQMVLSELNRLVPQATSQVAHGLSFEGDQLYGVHIPNMRKVIVSLESDHPIGTAMHESIHSLKSMKLFSDEEWRTLEAASLEHGWMDRFDVQKRWASEPPSVHVEESIAEAYRDWATGRLEVTPEVQTLFGRMKEFFNNLLKRVQAHLGMGPETTWEDIFGQVESGEVGRRGITDEMGRQEPRFQPAGDGTDVIPPFRAAREIGMTVPQYENYMKLIRKRQDADLAASTRRAETEQRRRQTAEWKANSEAMRPEVVSDLRARPDIAADAFLADGELYGKKLENSYKLRRDSLTREQEAALPSEYLTGRQGVEPDQIAHLFGYQSGDQMISHLAGFHATRKATGQGRERFFRTLTNMEIARRMEIQHGFLEKNILEDARDQVLSENQLDLLHEETHHLGMMAGAQLGDITRAQIESQIKAKFDALPMSVIDSDKWLKEAGKHGRNAELSLLSGNPAQAFQSKQAQYFNTTYATMARTVEKAKAKLDKAAKPFRKMEVKGVEPEYLNHIQDLLQQGGYKVGRSVSNIEENIARRGQTLEQFAESKLTESDGYRQLMIPDFVLDGDVKPVDKMSTWQFMGYKRALDALIKNAKDEAKIIREGETADRNAVLDEMKDHIREFDPVVIRQTRTRFDKFLDLPRAFIASTTSVETFLNRLGKRDPLSVFNKYVNYPLASAANRKSALQRQFSAPYREIGEVEDRERAVIPPPMMKDPEGNPLTGFTRGNVMVMIHNAGNKSNWEKFAKGWGADPDQLMKWLVANSDKDMWARAQKLGDTVFNEIIKLKDNEVEALNGITIDKLPLEPFTNPHGTFKGWYHPLIKDPIWEGKGKVKGGAYQDSDFGHITTNDGYTLKRTGAIYPVDLNPDMIPVRINQMLHDIAFQNTVLQVQKLFKDPALSNAITTHYGANYNSANLLLPYLKDIAGGESFPSHASAVANSVSETLRQNVISTYIGFNPSTVFKHGPTALVLSMKQVGAKNFLEAVTDLYRRSPDLALKNHEFAMQWSEELQRRERHWQDTVFGAHKEIEGATTWRDNIIQAGSWAVAKSDMASAKPTWLAAYRKGINDMDLTHGAAIDYADAQVRFAHGSTAITNQPALIRGGGALHNWYASVYGFFGTMMQRRIELAHDINDTYKFVKGGEFTEAARNIPGILADTMAYVFWPTIVEEAVTGLTTDDHRGWGTHAISAAFLGLSSSVLYLRDIAHSIESGRQPDLGLLPSALGDIAKGAAAPFKKDAYTKQRMGKTVGDTLTALGHLTGMAPKTIDNAIHFGIDLVNKTAHPRTPGDWYRGVARGTTKPREEK